MPRKQTGQIIEPQGGRGWAIRVRHAGRRHYVTLGRPADGWNRERVEAELTYTLAQIERGEWSPPEPEPVPEEPKPEPTFREFASEWFERHRPEWRENTINDYRWALSYHLLPYFEGMPLSAITARDVDAYKAAKLREARINAGQINKTLTRLAQILGEAVEYELIPRNVASGKKRRVKAPAPARTWVEPEQLLTLLEAAPSSARPVLATLAGCGLRVGEAVARELSDVSVPTATINIGRAKTDAGVRQVDMPLGVVGELGEWLSRRPAYEGEDKPLFVTDPPNGHPVARQTRRNVEHRLKAAIRKANTQLDKLGIEPISERVTPHSLRRTYASLRAACGDDPIYIAEQLGHADIAVTYRIYQKAAKRRAKLSGAHLREYDRALEWARIGPMEAEDRAANGQQAPFSATAISENHAFAA